MNPHIQQAIDHLRVANYTGYFAKMDLVEIPEHLQNPYATHKGRFMSGKTEYGFEQMLEVFAKEVSKTIGDKSQSEQNTGIAKHLTEKPFDPNVFLGREQDLENLRTNLTAENSNILVLINGEGGIGKTSLASKYYLKHEADYQHLAWLSAEPNIADALLRLAIPLGISFNEHATQEENRKLLLQHIANLPQPCLLVLDNANNLTDLQKHYKTLRQCSNFHLLVTSRVNELHYAQTYKVGALTFEKAQELFEKYYPKYKPEEQALFKKIYDAVEGNTLVIEILAKSLREQNRLKTNYSLINLYTDLATKGLLNVIGEKEVAVAWQANESELQKAKPKELIEAMYDLTKLSPTEQQLLRFFSLLPTENIPFERLEELLEIENLQENLLALSQKGWIEYNETENDFKCNQVVQEVIIEIDNALTLNDIDSLAHKLIDKLDYDGGHITGSTYEMAIIYALYGENLFLLAQKQGNIIEIEEGRFQNRLSILLERLGNYHSILGNLDKALQFFEKDLELNAQLYDDYPNNVSFKNGLAISYSNLGETHSQLGNLEKALQFFEKDLELNAQLYDDYPSNVEYKKNLAISYSKLGQTHSQLGNLDKALQFFEKQTDLFEQLYDDYPNNVSFKNGLAISYLKLGETHSQLGNLDKALQFFEKGLELNAQLYDDYPNNVSFKNGLAISYWKLGDFYKNQSDNEKAKAFFKKCQKLLKELAENFPNYVEFQENLEEVNQDLANLDSE